MNDSLSAIIGVSTAPSMNARGAQLDLVADRLIEVRELIKSLKEEERSLEDSVWTLTPEEVGEFEVEADSYIFTVSRSEKMSWDSDTLAAIVKSTPSSSVACVKVAFTVDKKQFDSLSDTEQRELAPALTRSPNKARVKITSKN